MIEVVKNNEVKNKFKLLNDKTIYKIERQLADLYERERERI